MKCSHSPFFTRGWEEVFSILRPPFFKESMPRPHTTEIEIGKKEVWQPLIWIAIATLLCVHTLSFSDLQDLQHSRTPRQVPSTQSQRGSTHKAHQTTINPPYHYLYNSPTKASLALTLKVLTLTKQNTLCNVQDWSPRKNFILKGSQILALQFKRMVQIQDVNSRI